MKQDTLILIGAAAVAYYIVTKPATAKTSTNAKPLPTTGDFARMDRAMPAPDTVGALGEPVSFFAPAGYI